MYNREKMTEASHFSHILSLNGLVSVTPLNLPYKFIA